MYQSVGSNIVSKIAEGMHLPIHLHEITGTSKCIDSIDYLLTDGDEVEDLFILLSDVLNADSSIKGVTCGAILSDYQRSRVEAVCSRLGLLVIAPLWARGQVELLDEMIDCKLNAVLAKCACYGLTGKHVGHSISELRNVFMKLRSTSGMFVCGEGGEYETVTLECALMDNKTKINLGDDCHKITHHKCDIAPSVLLVAPNPILIQDAEVENNVASFPYRIMEFLTTVAYLRDSGLYTLPPPSPLSPPSTLPSPVSPLSLSPIVSSSSRLYTTQWTAPNCDPSTPLAQQAEILFASLAPPENATPVFTEIQVRDMSMFATVNKAYTQSPVTKKFLPARACVQTILPKNVDLRARVTWMCSVNGQKLEVSTVKVDSLSTWATSAVGPYSQIVIPNQRVSSVSEKDDEDSTVQTVFVSGTIGLVPHDLSMPVTLSKGILANVSNHTYEAMGKFFANGRMEKSPFLDPTVPLDEKMKLLPAWVGRLVQEAKSIGDLVLVDAIEQLSFVVRAMRLVLQRSFGKRNGDGDFEPKFGYMSAIVNGAILFGSQDLFLKDKHGNLTEKGDAELAATRMKYLEQLFSKLCECDFTRYHEDILKPYDDEKACEERRREYDYDAEPQPDEVICRNVLSNSSKMFLPISSVIVGTLPKNCLVEVIPFAIVDHQKLSDAPKSVWKTSACQQSCVEESGIIWSFNQIRGYEKAQTVNAVIARVNKVRGDEASRIADFLLNFEKKATNLDKRIWVFVKTDVLLDENAFLNSGLGHVTYVTRLTHDAELEVIVNYMST
eukprot:GDKJ01064902.1.p1 GENE.GDKJ01064902.1~~GDKJ01064902.1.p1  ORF type:complete len:835 (+),score=164.27 GDKJ01064902.1:160-2505(+)